MSEQQYYHGDDSWKKIGAFLDELEAKRILLVTGRSAYQLSGAGEALAPHLEGRSVTRVSDFETNPKAEDISRLLKEIESKGDYDVIVAVGGGSVMDMAKLLKAFWAGNPLIEDYFADDCPDKVSPCALPLIAVPTTAGSGSEATKFAVVYKDQQKFSVEHERLLPALAVVIPSLLASMPPHIAASSGMDALCQGIESYWSIHSTDESRQLAAQAIGLAWESIEEAVLERTPEALENMAIASHFAGRAINITRTTAPHAVSYPMTSYFGITHGHAVGLLATHFLCYNGGVSEEDCNDPRGPDWVRNRLGEIVAMLGAGSIEEASDALARKLESVGLETNLHELGIKTERDRETIVKHFSPDRAKNNPREVSKEELMNWLSS